MKEKNEIKNVFSKLAKESLEHEVMMADRKELDYEICDDLLEFVSEVSILPMCVSESETEPATEVIVCSAISGGNDYVNDMPRELTITRKFLNGEEYKARYVLSK